MTFQDDTIFAAPNSLKPYSDAKFAAALAKSELARASLLPISRDLSLASVRNNSVSASAAQIERLCWPGNSLNISKSLLNIISLKNRDLPYCVKARIELMYLHGLRVSESLSIKPSDVIPTGSIYVSGLKGSHSRMVNGILYTDYWKDYAVNGYPLPTYYTRFYIYRVLKKAGVYYQATKNGKLSITHALRYNYINNLLNNRFSLIEIQNIIGHKSYQSTMHYIKNLSHV